MNTANPRLDQLFHSALDHDPATRHGFLVRACAGDAALLHQLRLLLSSDREAEDAGFWRYSALELAAVREAAQPDSRIGQILGHYKLLEAVGSGGMGTVYRAVRADAEYQQHVAIKIIKRGMDTDAIVRRFRSERQILAHLQHPNIARLLDGGTTRDGLPYLVMELVEGLPIDVYAAARNLTLRQVLELFRSVCAAVEYAHQNLVIHRDLKPGNILVSDPPPGQPPAPKLLDFGIAKLLDASADSPHATETMAPFLTPEYASPEQIRAEPVTTVSDVYSLGVLLYKLLTGQSPYRSRGRQPNHLADAICNQEPERPSAADPAHRRASAADALSRRRAIRGDLDNIVLMALRKEPERRYASVGLLAEDVRRYLDGLPVLAHPATFRYRARKFVCRNAIAVAAASLLFLTLAAGVVATAKQTRIARTERARAERRFQDVRKLANSLLFELHDSIEAVPGTLATRQLIVQRGLEYLDGLAPESGDDRVLKSELAVAYDRVGALTFDVNMALGSHRKALALNQALVQAEPANSKYESQLASSYDLLASVLRDYGDSPGALRYSRDAAAVMERLVSLHPENREWRASQANMYQTLGTNLSRVGRYAEALDIQRKALAINQAMLAADRSAVHARLAVVESYIYLSRSLLDLTDSAAALDAGRQALSLAEPVVAAHPGVPAYRRELWLAHARIAQALENLGRLPESLAAYRSGLDIIQSIAAADPGDRGNRRGVAWTLLALAHLLGRMNRVPEAIRTDQQAIAISRHLLQEDPNKLETTIDLGNMYTQLAAVGKQVDAFRQAREFFEAAARRDPANAVVERGRAELDRLSR